MAIVIKKQILYDFVIISDQDVNAVNSNHFCEWARQELSMVKSWNTFLRMRWQPHLREYVELTWNDVWVEYYERWTLLRPASMSGGTQPGQLLRAK